MCVLICKLLLMLSFIGRYSSKCSSVSELFHVGHVAIVVVADLVDVVVGAGAGGSSR